MIDHKQNPAEIYLVPMLGDDHDHIWCEDPAPGEGMREEDATRYVRADLVPASNEVLANSIAELTRKNSELQARVSEQSKVIEHIAKAVGEEADPMACWEAVDALKAQVEQLQRTTFDVVCASAILGVPIHEEESHKCLAARDADVSAKAVEAAANELASIFTAPPGMYSPAVIKLNLIANKLRQQAKAGKA